MRLIDADALNFVCVAPANDYGFGFLDGIDWAEEEVEKAPTIDGVEKDRPKDLGICIVGF